MSATNHLRNCVYLIELIAVVPLSSFYFNLYLGIFYQIILVCFSYFEWK